MSTELKYLAFTALLTASLWIPYVVAQVMTNGPLQPANYVDPTTAADAELGQTRRPRVSSTPSKRSRRSRLWSCWSS